MRSIIPFKTVIAAAMVSALLTCGAQSGRAAPCDAVAGFPAVMQVAYQYPGLLAAVPSYIDLALYPNGLWPEGPMIGKYDGWCVDVGPRLGEDGFYATPVCLYSPEATTKVVFPENLPSLNWLLDKVMKGQIIGSASSADCDGQVYTWRDVQAAVWLLVEGVISARFDGWSECRATELADLALASGASFTPGCNDYVGILLVAVEPTSTRQTTVMMVPVVCDDGGCTLTPGYWKTHSEYGPAPYDDTWANLPDGADTSFFLSGKTYYQALWTAPAGNVYYILAHAYIAAQLNFLNGASSPPEVDGAFADATALLNTYTPAQIGALRGSSAVRRQCVALASLLDNYNNGLIGPGHCPDEADTALEQGASVSPVLSPMRTQASMW